MIKFDRVSFRYDGAQPQGSALKDISLEIFDGDFVGIIGASGAGKTTLTYAINGVIPHHYSGEFYGSVTVNGVDTVDSKESLFLMVGSVFQDVDAQMVASMVEDELLFGLENYGIPHDEIETRICEALAAVGIEELRDRSIGSLSGGQKQKVAIAAILALRPSIIVLDEPTGELDPQSSRLIFSTLQSLNRDFGITVVLVEQKIMLQCEFAHKLILMEKGEVLAYDTVERVLGNPGLLENCGINCPRIVTLARDLEKNGLYSGAYPKNVDMAKKMLAEVLA